MKSFLKKLTSLKHLWIPFIAAIGVLQEQLTKNDISGWLFVLIITVSLFVIKVPKSNKVEYQNKVVGPRPKNPPGGGGTTNDDDDDDDDDNNGT